MGASDKSSEARKTAPAPAAPAAPGGPQTTESMEAQTNRLNAEAVKLMAEANESRVRQLKDLETLLASLQHNLSAEAERLQQLEQALRAREAKALEQAQSEHDQAAAARAQLVACQQELHRVREDSEQLHGQLWPAAFRGEPWRAWRVQVLSRAATDGPASLLLARLHAAAALEQCGRPLTMELLRDIGRSVHETFSGEAQKIAQALTQAAGGQFEIRTVRPGDRVDNKFMKPSAGGMVEVRAVSGWAVRDAKGAWQFLAEVS
jgi:hypothetical protein